MNSFARRKSICIVSTFFFFFGTFAPPDCGTLASCIPSVTRESLDPPLSAVEPTSLASDWLSCGPGACCRCASASSLLSAPFAQHARQKNFPRIPIWHANSLCIGLSPSSARTMGITRTGSFLRQSQAHMPSFWHFLKVTTQSVELSRNAEDLRTRAAPRCHPASPMVGRD